MHKNQRCPVRIVDLQKRIVPGGIGESIVWNAFVDPAVPTESYVVGVKYDAVLTVAWNGDSVFGYGM